MVALAAPVTLYSIVFIDLYIFVYILNNNKKITIYGILPVNADAQVAEVSMGNKLQICLIFSRSLFVISG